MSRRKYLNDFRVPQNPDRPSKNLKKLPKIWDVPMHWVQERASDSGHIYALGAEPCLGSWAYLCTGCRDLP